MHTSPLLFTYHVYALVTNPAVTIGFSKHVLVPFLRYNVQSTGWGKLISSYNYEHFQIQKNLLLHQYSTFDQHLSSDNNRYTRQIGRKLYGYCIIILATIYMHVQDKRTRASDYMYWFMKLDQDNFLEQPTCPLL